MASMVGGGLRREMLVAALRANGIQPAPWKRGETDIVHAVLSRPLGDNGLERLTVRLGAPGHGVIRIFTVVKLAELQTTGAIEDLPAALRAATLRKRFTGDRRIGGGDDIVAHATEVLAAALARLPERIDVFPQQPVCPYGDCARQLELVERLPGLDGRRLPELCGACSRPVVGIVLRDGRLIPGRADQPVKNPLAVGVRQFT